ncbi:MAG: twin-arginine translocase TatA/TatE family subunit [Gemmatimonadetes bacterium]|nr:MAG: twin-arginine translocase TatA/TatE family subunit [Gemmatimonadota bacterium]
MPFGGLGMGEMFLIFLVVLLVFGAKRIPEIARSFGRGISEFKRGVNEIEREINRPDEIESNNQNKSNGEINN